MKRFYTQEDEHKCVDVHLDISSMMCSLSDLMTSVFNFFLFCTCKLKVEYAMLHLVIEYIAESVSWRVHHSNVSIIEELNPLHKLLMKVHSRKLQYFEHCVYCVVFSIFTALYRPTCVFY